MVAKCGLELAPHLCKIPLKGPDACDDEDWTANYQTSIPHHQKALMSIHINPSAKIWTCASLIDPKVLQFHKTLPSYNETILTPLPDLAQDLGLRAVFVKDESNRFGLPAFKILGASWAVYRALSAAVNIPLTSSSSGPEYADLCRAVMEKGVKIVTCTEGNWGRAVARMGTYFGAPVTVYVPRYMDAATQELIRGEGAEVVVISGEYDDALKIASEHSETKEDLLVLDTSWDGYTEIPGWVTEGYSTMLAEVDQQLEDHGVGPATLAIASVGVGSWAHSVVAHYKSRSPSVAVVTVEPTAAPCLNTSLKAGKIVRVETGDTIMNGMNCGTVSSIAWPYLREGVDASLVIDNLASHQAVHYMHEHGVKAGPCGAAPLAALKVLVERSKLGLGDEDVVVLFCTEGAREYDIPTRQIK